MSTLEAKLKKMGSAAAAKRKRDMRQFTIDAMNLKASITALVDKAQKLIG